MLLCIDIGNTNIKLGLYEGERMRCHWRIATARDQLADEYAALLRSLMQSESLAFADINGCALSSVVPALTQVFSEVAERYFNRQPLVVHAEMIQGMRIDTDRPAEVGSDLIVNALAARRRYGSPLIVVGFGTATTFTAVSASGDLVGVAIAPGILTSGESLFRTTATLPQVALKKPQTALGKNTIASIQAGMVYGFTGLVEGVARRMKAELGGEKPVQVIATGGLASLIAPETEMIDAVEPDLALEGLRLVYENQAGA